MGYMLELLFLSLIGGLFSLIGGLILVWRSAWAKSVATPLMAFAAGAFLGAALLDLLPEAIEMVEEPHPVFWAALSGFVGFFILERGLMRWGRRLKEGHQHADHTEALPALLVFGDSVHNLIDGVLIGLAYVANPALGLTVALGTAAHEIPQEIADASILLNQGWSKRRVVLINILQSLLTIPGVTVGYLASGWIDAQLPYVLAGTAGLFLYLGASDIIPEIHHRAGHRQVAAAVIPLILSLVVIGYLVAMTHG
jgi:zinc and cadmium transporter